MAGNQSQKNKLPEYRRGHKSLGAIKLTRQGLKECLKSQFLCMEFIHLTIHPAGNLSEKPKQIISSDEGSRHSGGLIVTHIFPFRISHAP